MAPTNLKHRSDGLRGPRLDADRLSERVAVQFLDWLGLGSGLRWLDVGCGSGAVSAAILDRHDPGALIGVDVGDDKIAQASDRLEGSRAEFRAADALDLPFLDGRFDVAVSGLTLQTVPDAMAMIRQMVRIVRAGGNVGLYVWDYSGQMQISRHFWATAVALDPLVEGITEENRFPVCRSGVLRDVLLKAGLGAVRSCAIDVRAAFRSFDELWDLLSRGDEPTALYCKSLTDSRRAEFKASLMKRLPFADGQSSPLTVRAWAVTGVV